VDPMVGGSNPLTHPTLFPQEINDLAAPVGTVDRCPRLAQSNQELLIFGKKYGKVVLHETRWIREGKIKSSKGLTN